MHQTIIHLNVFKVFILDLLLDGAAIVLDI